MKKKKVHKLETVTVSHPWLPYRIRAHLPAKNLPFCVIRLTKGCARVIHIPSGLTLTDTVSVAVGYKVCAYLSNTVHESTIFSELTWKRFRAYQKGAEDKAMHEVQEVIRNMGVLGVLSPENTKNLRFKYSPEYTL